MEEAFILGRSGSWWDTAVICSLIVTVVVAAFVALATWGSVTVNKRNAIASEQELERYKSKAALEVAEAQATSETAKDNASQAYKTAGEANLAAAKAFERAASLENEAAQAHKDAAAARLETERLRADVALRQLSSAELLSLVNILKSLPHPTEQIQVSGLQGNRESIRFAGQIKTALQDAGLPVLKEVEEALFIEGVGPGIIVRTNRSNIHFSELLVKALNLAALHAHIAVLPEDEYAKLNVVISHSP